jgi:hypothetical protein
MEALALAPGEQERRSINRAQFLPRVQPYDDLHEARRPHAFHTRLSAVTTMVRTQKPLIFMMRCRAPRKK